MNINKILKESFFSIIIITILAIQIFVAQASFAATLPGDTSPTPPGETSGYKLPNPFDAESFEEVVQKLAAWFYVILTPVAIIMVLYSAFLFMTSAGDEEKIKRAKRTLLWVLVGVLIIIIGAGFITLIKDFLGAT